MNHRLWEFRVFPQLPLTRTNLPIKQQTTCVLEETNMHVEIFMSTT